MPSNKSPATVRHENDGCVKWCFLLLPDILSYLICEWRNCFFLNIPLAFLPRGQHLRSKLMWRSVHHHRLNSGGSIPSKNSCVRTEQTRAMRSLRGEKSIFTLNKKHFCVKSAHLVIYICQKRRPVSRLLLRKSYIINNWSNIIPRPQKKIIVDLQFPV